MVHGLVVFAMFEVVPLWAISSRELGGLDLSQRDLGIMLASSAVVTMLSGWFVMPVLTRLFGLRRCSSICGLVGAITFLFMPWATQMWQLILMHTTVNFSLNVLISSTVLAFTNNATPPEHRGVVNGVAVTLETLAKGVGPISTSITFAWTLERWGYAGHPVVFVAMAAGAFMVAVGCACLPKTVENVVSEGNDAQEEDQRSAEASISSVTPTQWPKIHDADNTASPEDMEHMQVSFLEAAAEASACCHQQAVRSTSSEGLEPSPNVAGPTDVAVMDTPDPAPRSSCATASAC